MIDLQDLRKRPDAYQDAAKKKRIKVDVHAFLKVDEERRTLLPLIEEMRAKKNKVSKDVPAMKGEDKTKAIAEMKEMSATLKAKEDALVAVEKQWEHMQLLLPSIPLDIVPVGKDDTENKEIRKWGNPSTALRVTESEVKDHVTLGQELDIIDILRGAKNGGSRS